MGNRLVTCNKCGKVHMGYTREQAQAEVDKFNAYFDTLTEYEQQDYYGGHRSSIARYEKCWCGSQSFRPYKEGDCPKGVTLNPVIADV